MPALRLELYPRITSYAQALELYKNPMYRTSYGVQLRPGSGNYTIVERDDTIVFMRENLWLVRYHLDGVVEANESVKGHNAVAIQNRLLPDHMQRALAEKNKQRPFSEIYTREVKGAAKVFDEVAGRWVDRNDHVDPETLEAAALALDYDPTTETFTWKSSGSTAGSVNARGYRKISIWGKQVYAHQLAAVWDSRPRTITFASLDQVGDRIVETVDTTRNYGSWFDRPVTIVRPPNKDGESVSPEVRPSTNTPTPDLSHIRVVGWGETLPSAAPKKDWDDIKHQMEQAGLDMSDWIEE